MSLSLQYWHTFIVDRPSLSGLLSEYTSIKDSHISKFTLDFAVPTEAQAKPTKNLLEFEKRGSHHERKGCGVIHFVKAAFGVKSGKNILQHGKNTHHGAERTYHAVERISHHLGRISHSVETTSRSSEYLPNAYIERIWSVQFRGRSCNVSTA